MWTPSPRENLKSLPCGVRGKALHEKPPKLSRFPQAHSNDVVLCSLCPPRGWSGGGGGNQNVEEDLLTFGYLRPAPALLGRAGTK